MQSVTVRVPATTANFAAGFDALGCALSLYNTLTFTISDRLSFTGCEAMYQNCNNLSVQGYAAVCRCLGLQVPPLHIDIKANIPISRGLGSSASLLASGAIAANAMFGNPLSRDELLQLTTPIEGHPDNLAPAYYGGMTASFLENGYVYTTSYIPHETLHFVAISPDFPLSTSHARSVLPTQVSFEDAVFNGAHLSVLLRALEIGDEPLVAAALQDRLHQPYRFPLIDGYSDIRCLAEKNGCKAMCISGAGPTLLCITRDTSFALAMQHDLSSLSHHWDVRDLTVDFQGAQCVNTSD